MIILAIIIAIGIYLYFSSQKKKNTEVIVQNIEMARLDLSQNRSIHFPTMMFIDTCFPHVPIFYNIKRENNKWYLQSDKDWDLLNDDLNIIEAAYQKYLNCRYDFSKQTKEWLRKYVLQFIIDRDGPLPNDLIKAAREESEEEDEA